MKKSLTLCLLIFSLTAIKLGAQPWYGMQIYGVDSCVLTSAKVTTNSVGYVMAAYRPARFSAASPDFIVNKVDGNGQYSSSNDFYAEYQLNDCSGSPIQNCFGVNIIETAPTGHNQYYAVAATSAFGIHFLTLDQSGGIAQNLSFSYPALPSLQKRPAIRESATPGHYYVCASYREDSAVVMKIDATGLIPSILWSYFYESYWMEPTDLIESPYNANELIVVGRCDIPAFAPNADGFFMSLNSANGSLNSFISYTKYIVFHCDEWFSSIEIANSTAGGSNGYILGGRSNYGTVYTPSCNCYTSGNYEYTQWMCKLDPNGGMVWSTLIEPKDASLFTALILPGSEISRVYERKNSNTNNYEYYGVADEYMMPSSTGPIQSGNAVVYKLDDSGSNSITPNEFHFSPAVPTFIYSNSQITGIETNGGSDDGIQVYANYDLKNLMFAKAYFNGVAGCNDLQVDVDAIYQGPDSTTTTNVNFNPYTGCLNGAVSGGVISLSGSTICATSSVTGGSNAKPNSTVGLSSVHSNNNFISVYPNPFQGELTLNISQVNFDDNLKIKIYDNLGALRGELSETPKNIIKLDFKKLGLTAGVYFLDIQNEQETAHIKVIYTP